MYVVCTAKLILLLFQLNHVGSRTLQIIIMGNAVLKSKIITLDVVELLERKIPECFKICAIA